MTLMVRHWMASIDCIQICSVKKLHSAWFHFSSGKCSTQLRSQFAYLDMEHMTEAGWLLHALKWFFGWRFGDEKNSNSLPSRPRTMSSCAPFQPLPIRLCNRVFFFDPWMRARSAQRANRFVKKEYHQNASSSCVAIPTDAGRLSSPLKSHWKAMCVAT